jgi:hypothetical protein
MGFWLIDRTGGIRFSLTRPRFFFTPFPRSAIMAAMATPKKNKQEALLQELIAAAERAAIEVRTEKLLREVGYHARSGGCRVKGQRLIIVDRDAPLGAQIEFLTEELAAEGVLRPGAPPPKNSD